MDRLTREGAPRVEVAQGAEDCWSSLRIDAVCAPVTRDLAPVADSADKAPLMDWLVRTVEAEIIPRLMLAHRTGVADRMQTPQDRKVPGPLEVAELVSLVLGVDAERPREYVQKLREHGASLEVLYLDLLAPAARQLGVLWEEDLCDFTQVTLGLWRLQQVVYDFSPSFQGSQARSPHGRRAMLVPVPGSQHTFGVLLVAEFFRRAGWEVWSEPSASADQLVLEVRSDWFDVIGLSLGAEVHLSRAASVILALRKASMNPGVVVMIGGPVVALRPELAALVGADVTATSATQAVSLAEQMVPGRERSC
jgi:methanogenic corrinoid protein MtbC1